MSEENVFDNIQGVTYHFSKDGLLEDWREEALRHREEIERLNNIIKKLERLIDDYAWNSYYIKCGNRYLKSEILNDIREIIEIKGDNNDR